MDIFIFLRSGLSGYYYKVSWVSAHQWLCLETFRRVWDSRLLLKASCCLWLLSFMQADLWASISLLNAHQLSPKEWRAMSAAKACSLHTVRSLLFWIQDWCSNNLMLTWWKYSKINPKGHIFSRTHSKPTIFNCFGFGCCLSLNRAKSLWQINRLRSPALKCWYKNSSQLSG